MSTVDRCGKIPEDFLPKMNRAERRSAAALAKKLSTQKHRPPRQPGKPIRPWPHEVRHVFAPIEQIFDELRQGEITEINGNPAFRDSEWNWFTVSPAIAGWVDTWQRLNQQFGLNIDLAPLQALGEALDTGAMLTMPDVEAAYQVIVRCREAYRGMDVYAVKRVVRDSELAILLADSVMGKE